MRGGVAFFLKPDADLAGILELFFAAPSVRMQAFRRAVACRARQRLQLPFGRSLMRGRRWRGIAFLSR